MKKYQINHNAIMPLVRVCPGCSDVLKVVVRVRDYNDWKLGLKPAHLVFPNFSDDEIIFVTTNHCPQCFDEVMTTFRPLLDQE